MSLAQVLREFISNRLTAAAGEIFSVFEKTIAPYEEEIDRQRRHLEISMNPQIKLHRSESPQQHIHNQETTFSLEQEEHNPSHIKDEEEDVVQVTVTAGESPNSHKSVRDLTSQLLTAAAVEIFNMFEQTIVQYKKEITHPHRLLEISWNPQIKLNRTELPQHHDCREEQLIKQETTYCLEQGEPEPPQPNEEQEEPGGLQFKDEQGKLGRLQFKEEQEEQGLIQFKEDQKEPQPSWIEEHGDLGTSQEGERIIVNFDSDTFKKLKLCQNVGTLTHKNKITCQVCGKSYTRQHNLLVHMRSHTGEKPFSCKFCGKSCSRKNDMLVHMRSHTGEKPYCCETCGKSFSQQSHLLVHKRSHTGEKPYSCEVCEKSFSQQGHLLVHMRSHTGEKPYCCEMCGKTFSQQGHLLSHMQIHIG